MPGFSAFFTPFYRIIIANILKGGGLYTFIASTGIWRLILFIDLNIKSLYEDKYLGKLPENIFQNLLSDFVTEQSVLEDKLQKMRLQLSNQECTEHEIGKWLRLISQYMEIKELDRPTVMELIEGMEEAGTQNLSAYIRKMVLLGVAWGGY